MIAQVVIQPKITGEKKNILRMSCCPCEPSFEVKTSHLNTGQSVSTDHTHKDIGLYLRNYKINYNYLKIKYKITIILLHLSRVF